MATISLISIGLALSLAAYAQETAAPLTISQAVASAVRNYPSIRVTQEQMTAAAAAIRLAQTAYLPRIDSMIQLNRATRNTFYGLLLPQIVIPGVDGVHANNFGSVWDSGIGILVTWQPFDFGLRAANVAVASASRDRAQATIARTEYDVSVATADAFLTTLAAQQTAEAARAAVDSWRTLLTSTHALVAAQLRPGGDESRVAAELALAQIQAVQAEQAIEVARATLAQFAGVSAAALNLDPARLIANLPAERTEGPLVPASHPLALEQRAVTGEEQARLGALDRTYYPQFSVQGVAAARGTGMLTDGARLGGLNGLAPTTQNYGLGFTVTFPAMDRFAIREQQAIAAAQVRATEARSSVIATNLQARFDAAIAALAGALRVAEITPAEVSSARAALQQATARYQAGLAPVDDVAQAQRFLAQARIDDSLARLNVWRARLAVETARGNIQPFLAESVQ
jgi:outer membrane protein TolC